MCIRDSFLPLFTLGFTGCNVAQSWFLKDWIRTMQREGRLGGGRVSLASEEAVVCIYICRHA